MSESNAPHARRSTPLFPSTAVWNQPLPAPGAVAGSDPGRRVHARPERPRPRYAHRFHRADGRTGGGAAAAAAHPRVPRGAVRRARRNGHRLPGRPPRDGAHGRAEGDRPRRQRLRHPRTVHPRDPRAGRAQAPQHRPGLRRRRLARVPVLRDGVRARGHPRRAPGSRPRRPAGFGATHGEGGPRRRRHARRGRLSPRPQAAERPARRRRRADGGRLRSGTVGGRRFRPHPHRAAGRDEGVHGPGADLRPARGLHARVRRVGSRRDALRSADRGAARSARTA